RPNDKVYLEQTVGRDLVGIARPRIAGIQFSEISPTGPFLKPVGQHDVGNQGAYIGKLLLQTSRASQTPRHRTKNRENGEEKDRQRERDLQQRKGAKPGPRARIDIPAPKSHRIASTVARAVTHSSDTLRNPFPACTIMVNSSLVPLG